MIFFRILILLFIFSSCSKLQTGYKWAPRFIANKLDDSFDFKSKRYDVVKKTIQIDLESNKKTIVENIIVLIDEAQLAIGDSEISESESKALVLTYKDRLKKIVLSFQSSFDVVMLNLDTDEKKSILAHFKKSITERTDLLSKKDKFVDKSTDRFENIFEYFFDDMNKQQQKIFQDFLSENFIFFEYQLKKRTEFSEKFNIALNPEKLSQLNAAALNFFSGDTASRTKEHQDQVIAFDQQTSLLIGRLWAATADQQKMYFKEKLKNLKADLLEL